MEPICINYRLKAGVFDAFVRILYKYDPSFPDQHAKPFYCMLKHNHGYALNYDLESLEPKLNDEGDKTRACAS